MIETTDIVVGRYGVSRERQGEYALEGQRRTAAGQQAGRYDAEMAPLETTNGLVEKDSDEVRQETVTLRRDEGNRPEMTLEGFAKLKPVRGESAFITCGECEPVERWGFGLRGDGCAGGGGAGVAGDGGVPGLALAGCEPDEMGIGPVYVVPRSLKRFRLRVEDIDLWELNEAFASKVLYSADRLGFRMTG